MKQMRNVESQLEIVKQKIEFDKKIEDFVFHQTKDRLGSGQFGDVFKCTNIWTFEQYALKVIRKNLLTTDYLKNLVDQEILVLHSVKSPYIVRYYKRLESPNNIYMVTELCDNIDFKQYISMKNCIPEAQAKEFTRQIIEGFLELQKNGIVHRDLKPANLLMKNGQIKIADFGFAKIIDNFDKLLMSSIGSPLYMSPQLLKSESYTSKCDVWSLGVILYQMLYNKLPWPAQDVYNLTLQVESQQIELPNDIPVSEDMKKFLKKCLEKQELNRYSWLEAAQDTILIKILSDEAHKNIQSLNLRSSADNTQNTSLSGINKTDDSMDSSLKLSYSVLSSSSSKQKIIPQISTSNIKIHNVRQSLNNSQVSSSQDNKIIFQNQSQNSFDLIEEMKFQTPISNRNSLYQGDTNESYQQDILTDSDFEKVIKHFLNTGAFYKKTLDKLKENEVELLNFKDFKTTIYTSIYALLKFHLHSLSTAKKILEQKQEFKKKKQYSDLVKQVGKTAENAQDLFKKTIKHIQKKMQDYSYTEHQFSSIFINEIDLYKNITIENGQDPQLYQTVQYIEEFMTKLIYNLRILKEDLNTSGQMNKQKTQIIQKHIKILHCIGDWICDCVKLIYYTREDVTILEIDECNIQQYINKKQPIFIEEEYWQKVEDTYAQIIKTIY